MKNLVTIFLADGQILRHSEEGTQPQLQRKYDIGRSLNINGENRQTITAVTIESETIKTL